MRKLSAPKLPVFREAGNEVAVSNATEPIIDCHRQQIMDDYRLSIMHTRLYDHWRPIVGAPTAYRLAMTGWSNEAEYQRLKREAGQI